MYTVAKTLEKIESEKRALNLHVFLYGSIFIHLQYHGKQISYSIHSNTDVHMDLKTLLTTSWFS